jgi:hypothetical protein
VLPLSLGHPKMIFFSILLVTCQKLSSILQKNSIFCFLKKKFGTHCQLRAGRSSRRAHSCWTRMSSLMDSAKQAPPERRSTPRHMSRGGSSLDDWLDWLEEADWMSSSSTAPNASRAISLFVASDTSGYTTFGHIQFLVSLRHRDLCRFILLRFSDLSFNIVSFCRNELYLHYNDLNY